MELSKFNRENLSKKITEGAVILHGNNTVYRNNDVAFDFRQDSNFHYLTAWPEPFAHAIITIKEKQPDLYLFVQDRNVEMETWDGKRLGYKGASNIGADEGHDIKEFDSKFLELIKNKERIYLQKDNIHLSTKIDALVDQAKKEFGRTNYSFPEEFFSISPILHEMRLFKDEDEISIMKKACSISAQAHIRAMKSVKPGMFEYELEAEYVHEFMKNGARDCAYTPIVGSGNNSCILHYNQNDRKMENGDLVLVDAGCEYQGYASDITRTFPVNGKFSPEQKLIYEIVLEAHKNCIEMLKPGISWMDVHRQSIETITKGLIEINLLSGSLEENIEKENYSKFYMHRVGHWLGLDVHDVGGYGSEGDWRLMEPGMVTTIEPGIYIKEGLEGVPEEFHKIGVRIEDDVLITDDGYEILSSEVPVDVESIEKLASSD